MSIDRLYRNQASGVAGNASTENPFLLKMVWQDFLFCFDLRAGCLIWCEVLKGQSMRWGDLCPSKYSDTYPIPPVRLSGEKKLEQN